MKLALGLLTVLLPALPAPTGGRAAPVILFRHAFQDHTIDESSGVVASRKHPGLLWTMNDSGGAAALFLTDTAGAALGVFRVPGAINRDWESLSLGPCGTTQCIYIGDTGDNGERRHDVTIYRIAEPEPLARAQFGTTAPPQAIRVQYPDGPHDVEAIYVEPEGSVILVTKGRSGGVHTYRIPSSAWGTSDRVVPQRVDSLPIPVSMWAGRVVTDAAFSAEEHSVAVRTYREVWYFTRRADGHLEPDPARPVCDLNGVQRQGEGVDWWNGNTLVLTSERADMRAGTILLVRCPGP